MTAPADASSIQIKAEVIEKRMLHLLIEQREAFIASAGCLLDACTRLPSIPAMLTSILTLALFGILLLMLETFLPGMIAGIIGTLSLLASLWLTFTAEELNHWSGGQRASLAIGILLITTVIMLAWLKWFAVKFFRRGFTLDTAIKGTAETPLAASPGSQGIALTELRPLGHAEIAGKRFEVRCQTGHAPAGAKVEVIAAEFGSLLVRAI
ncbi:MAG: NfeD family protein [Verrucomicrobiaceae bacterium]|nr:NfeD family protein [Verrucomicrobiaceae bacterium]